MTVYYSKSTNGFYNDFINKFIPNDAIEISEDQYESLFKAQNSGKIIQSDKNGNPEFVDPSLPTKEQLNEICKLMVQQLLDKTAIDWGYDSLVSAASYANSSNPQFKSEAESLIAWRDKCWTAFFALDLKALPENYQVLGTMLSAAPTKPVA